MSARRLLVVGRSGQVAQALAAVAGTTDAELICLGRPDLDLMRPERLAGTIEALAPDAILNAAAYTSVDKAESEPEAAFALNEAGPVALAEAARAVGAPLIHLSTDCVFDGRAPHRYTPADEPAPLGVYGRSKLAGEHAIAGPGVLIVRVSWIFSRFGSNFVRTMLDLARQRDELRVVCDQQGCPTQAEDLARGLIEMALQASAPDFTAWGTYHLAGAGEIDRALMAQIIFAESRALGGPGARVIPVATADYPTPAQRPLNARLDSGAVKDTFGVALPDWRDRIGATVAQLLDQEPAR